MSLGSFFEIPKATNSAFSVRKWKATSRSGRGPGWARRETSLANTARGLTREAVGQMSHPVGMSARNRLQPDVRPSFKHPLSHAQQQRRDVQAKLIDQAGREVLIEGRGAAGDGHVAVAGRGACLL